MRGSMVAASSAPRPDTRVSHGRAGCLVNLQLTLRGHSRRRGIAAVSRTFSAPPVRVTETGGALHMPIYGLDLCQPLTGQTRIDQIEFAPQLFSQFDPDFSTPG